MSGVVLPVGHVVVARRLGLCPEKDSEEQHDEKEEDGATHGQGHDHLCVCSIACQLALLLPVLGHHGLCKAKEVLQWTAVRAARQEQGPGGLLAFVPEVHLH